jgi:hypothetical protein
MSVFAGALPEFLGSLCAALVIAGIRSVHLRLKARPVRSAPSESTDDDPLATVSPEP